MKKTLLLFAFLFLAASSFAGDLVISKVYRFKAGDGVSPSTEFSYHYTNDYVSVQLVYSGILHAVPYAVRTDSLLYNASQSASTSQSYSRPFLNPDSGIYSPIASYSLLCFVDLLAARLVYGGFTIPEQGFNPNTSSIQIVDTNSSDTVRYNLRSLNVVNAALVSTNTAWRSFVIQSLSSLSSDLRQLVVNSSSGLGALSDLGSALESLSVDYGRVHSFDLNVSTNFDNSVLDWSSGLGVFSYGLDEVVDQVGIAKSQGIGTEYFSAVRRGYDSLISDAYKAYFSKVAENPDYVGVGNLQRLIENPSQVQSILSSSYSTPLTNALKKMTTDWKDGVTNELAQNTANITNQLAQWKSDLKGHNDSVTNDLSKIGNAVADVERNTKGVADLLSGTAPNKAHVVVDNAVNVNVLNWPTDFQININANDLDILARASGDSAKEILDNLTNRVDALTNGVASLPVSLDTITNLLSKIDVDMLDNLTNLDFSVSLTNELWNYYFTRFRRANEFEDENGQGFRVDSAANAIFGHGFDSGEFSNLNWFSRIEVLLYQVGRVFGSTNAIESADIESALGDSVDQLEQHGSDFVAASRRVVGLFGLIDRFAKSMKLAFGSYSNPVTSGILLLPSGSWIGNHALVLNIPVSVQNALRLVFQCIWYLSAFVIGWRVISSVWSKVVSFVRWLWSLIDV